MEIFVALAFHGFLEYRLRVLGHGITKHLNQPGIQSGDVGDLEGPGSDPNGRLLGIVTEGVNSIEIKTLGELCKHIVYSIGKTARSLSDGMIQRIVDILGCINKQVAVEFNYHKVTEGAIEHKDDNIVYRRIYPLQVRTFEDRYYLVGIEVGQAVSAENIKHFPIDRIHRRVDIALDDESEEPLVFDWQAMVKQTDFENHYRHCIGMYREFGKHAQPEYIHRWFRGWAASQVQAVPIHPSQEIVQKTGGEIRIRLYVYNTPDVQNVFNKYGSDSWE